MKAVMYHYIRADDPEFPYFRHLHVEDFVKQIDYFEKEYGFVGKREFQESILSGSPKKGIILTFDDGFKDHYTYVLPELKKRDLWGIFYIPMSPYIKGNLIDVHRIHLLIGKYGGSAIADALQEILADGNILSSEHIKEFSSETYTKQDNDESTNFVKRALNYFIDYKYREEVIDGLMNIFFPNEKELIPNFYMSKKELESMHAEGMVLGSHTINHPVMSKLDIEEQESEIVKSFEMIDSIVRNDDWKTFCYPYGGYFTFTPETEKLLEENDCRFSFMVESRDIDRNDLTSRLQALPRYDCNEFPHGSSR